MLKKKIKFFIYNFFNLPSIKNISSFKSLLGNELITFVDVGATDGIDKKFEEIEELLHIITFDPDPRANIIKMGKKFNNYSIGLWSNKNEKKLNLLKYPQASSLFNISDELNVFLNSEEHKKIGEQKIEVNSLENILKNSIVDFLKIDAEGADLEILKGAEKYLLNSCLAIQVEVSFMEKHQTAPQFSHIDQYLKKFDFILFDLESQKWIRHNNTYNMLSNPQLIWGNAIYVLSIKSFLKKITTYSFDQKQKTLLKYLILLLIFRFHDYALDLCIEASNQQIISPSLKKHLLKLIKTSIPSTKQYVFKHFFGIFIALLILPVFLWHKRTRKFILRFLKGKIINLSKILIKFRHGPQKCCING